MAQEGVMGAAVENLPDATHVVRARIAVSVGFLLGGTTLGLWAVHIPVVTARLALDPAVLGLALLGVGTGAVLAPPFVGWFIGRLGSAAVSTVLLPFFIVMMVAAVAAISTPMLFVIAVLLGIGGGGYNVAINTQASEVEKARKRPIMSSFHGFWSLGGLAGASLGGGIIALGWHNGGGVAVLAIIMAVVGLVASRSFLTAAAKPDEAGAITKERRFVLPTAALLGIVVIAFLSEFIEGSVVNWSALYLSTVRGLSEAEAAIGFSLFSLAMAVCRLAGGPVIARLGERTIVLGGGVLIAIGFAIVLLSPWPLLSPLGFAIVAVGAANTNPVLIGAASRAPGIAPGVGVAAVVTALTMGYLAAPPLIGFIAQLFGLSLALGLLAVAAVAIAALAAMQTWQPISVAQASPDS
jgi:MFS family permease